jgi:carboxyl-terminal processing protease
MEGPTTGYVRLLEFSPESPARLKAAIDSLATSGATRYVIDLRGAARGDLDDGVGAARLFVPTGTLAIRQAKGDAREPITSASGDGAITAPVVLIIDQGTSGAGEVFAAALRDNARATLVGEQTIGRAARQRLVKLPDGSGLLISNVRYLTPKGQPIHEAGVQPETRVEQPEVEFGAQAPTPDQTLARAFEIAAQRQ